jgi:hypothetical protein
VESAACGLTFWKVTLFVRYPKTAPAANLSRGYGVVEHTDRPDIGDGFSSEDFVHPFKKSLDTPSVFL